MRRAFATLFAVGIVLGGAVPSGAHGPVDHGAWDRLLRQYVHDGLVDYEGLKDEQQVLEEYLERIADVHIEHVPSAAHQLAFWVNAYNAYVINGVLDRYPLRSVRTVSGFFKSLRYPVGGEELTLDHMAARGRALGDWRIHFALVCASSSCPPLRAEAYTPDRVEAQLTEQTRAFLRDARRGLKIQGKTLWVSKLFQWYASDFIPKEDRGAMLRLTADRLLRVLEPYLDERTKGLANDQRLGLKLFPYDWALNVWVGQEEVR